jgi:HSP20 family protein
MANIIRRERPQHREMARPAQAYGWDPFSALSGLLRWDPFGELDRMVTAPGGVFVPEFDVRETPDAYVFKADVPGVKQDDLEIELTADRITISGKREEEKADEKDTYFVSERPTGGFSRSFRLPQGFDPDQVRAELKDGVLTLSAPKRQEVKGRKIQVGTGQAPAGEGPH